MPSAPKKQWNEVGHYYEEKQTDGSYRKMERTKNKKLTEEKFSAVLLDLMKPNHNEKWLSDPADLQHHTTSKTKGTDAQRSEDDFDEWESPIVYWKKKKVQKKEQMVPMLRWVSTTRPTDLYLTFIHKKLWDYNLGQVETMIASYKEDLKKFHLWEDYGWSDEIPPEKGTRGKEQFNKERFIKLLQEKQKERASPKVAASK